MVCDLDTWVGALEMVKRRVQEVLRASRHARGLGVDRRPIVHIANDLCRPLNGLGGSGDRPSRNTVTFTKSSHRFAGVEIAAKSA